MFLFHTGSIKSEITEFVDDALARFLFHTGSIKRQGCDAQSSLKQSFYSILVRLKGFDSETLHY